MSIEKNVFPIAKESVIWEPACGCGNISKVLEEAGYSLTSELPKEIDDMQPDYSIYPNLRLDTSFGFLTRGCPNKCSWCVVPRKEGEIHPYWDIDRVANGRKKIVLMDNNIFTLT